MPSIGPIELIAVLAMAVLALAIVVAILFVVTGWAARSAFGHDRRQEADLGARVVRERFARGEISREDAEAGVRALGRDLGHRA